MNNEEIYYFRSWIDTVTGDCSSDGFAMHRTYTDDGEIDVNVAVRDGDVFTIPRGYHGPCVAAAWLSALLPQCARWTRRAERSMAFCDDPTHHWVRELVGERAGRSTATDDVCGNGPVGPAAMIRTVTL